MEKLIAGDFNFHVDDVNNVLAQKFLRMLDSFDYVQHVNTITHKGNHTLDLVITRSQDKLVCNTHVSDPVLSDHHAVHCKVLLTKPPFARKEVTYRKLKGINFPRFRSDIMNSILLSDSNSSSSLDELVRQYETTLTSVLNDHAPVKKKVITLRPTAPWFNREIQVQKVERRRLERKWRKTKLTVHRELYTQQCDVVHKLISAAKKSYYSDLISECGSDQRELFKNVEKLLQGKTENQYPPSDSIDTLANQFADYFDNKTSVIETGLLRKCSGQQNPLPGSTCLLQCDNKLQAFPQ